MSALIRDVIMPKLVQLTVASEISHIRFPFPQLGSKKNEKARAPAVKIRGGKGGGGVCGGHPPASGGTIHV